MEKDFFTRLLNIKGMSTFFDQCSGLLNKKELSQFLSTQMSYLEENPHIYMKIMKEVRIE
ncbi:MAG: hypothetical protein PVH61_32685 [Candidatus Aminicenantes bacterium]